MCEKEPFWWNDFEFSFGPFKYEMRNGFLSINNMEYRESENFEIYYLAREYYRLAIRPT
jgi:hypothetical protein